MKISIETGNIEGNSLIIVLIKKNRLELTFSKQEKTISKKRKVKITRYNYRKSGEIVVIFTNKEIIYIN